MTPAPEPGPVSPFTYSPEFQKTFLPYSAIPPYIKDTIEIIIRNEEGGWVLSSDPDGKDGGFTFAGITANTFKKVMPYLKKEDILEGKSNGNLNIFSMRVIEIYYKEYYEPMLDRLYHEGAGKAGLDGLLGAAVYSCAVNEGPTRASQIYLEASKEFSYSQLFKNFLRLWALHYVAIVKAEPEKIQFLDGWLNRVFKHVS